MTTKFLMLTMVLTGVSAPMAQVEDHDDVTHEEDDNVVQLSTAQTPPEATCPVMVNVDQIRNLYPRKPERNGTPRFGTRLSMVGGGHIAVTDTFEAVRGMIEEATRA
jgi:hypothetical protein